MSRQDQYNVTVSVTLRGVTKNLGTFAKLNGGEVGSENSSFPPGGMQDDVDLGGRRKVSAVTVQRLFDLFRDKPLEKWLVDGVGKAEVTVVKTSLDIDGRALPDPLVYVGKLGQYTPTEPDSESTDAALFELEIPNPKVA